MKFMRTRLYQSFYVEVMKTFMNNLKIVKSKCSLKTGKMDPVNRTLEKKCLYLQGPLFVLMSYHTMDTRDFIRGD